MHLLSFITKILFIKETKNVFYRMIYENTRKKKKSEMLSRTLKKKEIYTIKLEKIV